MLGELLFSLILQDPPTNPGPAPAPAEVGGEPAEYPLRILRQPLPSFSERGHAAGHTGSAVVEAVLYPDGSLGPVTLVQSSRSEFLDADAVASVEEAGFSQLPEEAVRLRLTVEFRPVDLLTMSCGSFVQQIRWYESAWPERTYADTITYIMQLGYEVLKLRDSAGVRQSLALGETFGATFERALAACERSPGQNFHDTLHREMRRG
jgi:TonB family protein